MTTSCGLYARAILQDLADPVSSYPALALAVLPVGLLGLFMLAILATVMSTVDSYSFLAATTFGNDILRRSGLIAKDQITRYTRIGLVLTTLLAVLMALFFRSVVDIWYVFGSVGTPALLLPEMTYPAAPVAGSMSIQPVPVHGPVADVPTVIGSAGKVTTRPATIALSSSLLTEAGCVFGGNSGSAQRL